MIATGTDVKPLECLLFMRDVKSKNYFEQMKGRGTRVLDADDLKKVTPSAKTHYVIVDAIGVTKSLKTASQPLDTKPSIPLKDLAMGVMMGAARDTDSVTSLAGRLSRLDRQIDDTQRAKIEDVAGQPLRSLIRTLFDAVDPDKVMEQAQTTTGQDAPNEAAQDEARSTRVAEAAKSLNGTLINTLDTIRRDLEQTVDHDNLDHVTRAEWAGDTDDNAKELSADFESYLTDNRDRLEALTIYFAQPARRAEITFAMIREVLDALRADAPRLAPLNVWRAYAHLDDFKGNAPERELEALVALIRRVAGLDATLTPHGDRIRKNFQNWVLKRHAGKGDKFDAAQMDWLRMIRDHLVTSFHIARDDLDMAPFDGQGGLGRMYQLFGEDMEPLMDEMNDAVAG